MGEPAPRPSGNGAVRLSEAARASIRAAREAREAEAAAAEGRSAQAGAGHGSPGGAPGTGAGDGSAVSPRRAEAASRPIRNAAGTVLLIHALLVVVFTLLMAAAPGLRDIFDPASLRGATFGALLMQGGFILLPTLAIIFLLRLPPQQIAGIPARPGGIILALLVGVPAAVVLSGLNNLLLFLLAQSGISLPASPASAFTLDFASQQPAQLALVGIVSILLPAIGEELMFRGLILGSLRERTGEGMAIFLQAFVFMAFHTNPAFLLPPFLAGLLLGLIRTRTGSLMAAVTAHLSLNASLALLGAFLPRFTQRLLEITTQSSRSLLYASLMATCLAAVALVPLIILVAGSPPPEYYHRRRRQMPADLSFLLATLLLLATIIYKYFNP